MFVWKVFVSLALFGLGQAYKPCIDYESVKLSPVFVAGINKMYVIAQSNCVNCEKDEDWKWMFGRSSPKSICYKAQVNIRGEDFSLDFKCDYKDFGTLSCELDTTSLSGDKKVGVKGVLKIAGTDSTSWFALTMCLYGKEQVWILVATEPTLPDAEKSKAMKALDDLGFDTKVLGAELIKFNSFDLTKCS